MGIRSRSADAQCKIRRKNIASASDYADEHDDQDTIR